MNGIRKQVYELTVSDLMQFPVWEFAMDEEGLEGQDEATVRPQPAGFALEGEGMMIVRARFELADGTRMLGYLTPAVGAERSDLGVVQPALVGPFGQMSFWMGIVRPKPSDLEEAYARIGKRPDQIFPLKFTSDVEVRGGLLSGTVPGFLVIEGLATAHRPEVLR